MIFRRLCFLIVSISGFLSSQENPDYLIITSPELLPSAAVISNLYENETAPEFRLNTTIISTESISNQYSDMDLPAAIREFVLQMISENDHLNYLLIIGDETVVPPYYDNYGIPSDDYLSSQELTPPQSQLSTGRITAGNLDEAALIVNKIRNYVLDPPTGSWKGSMLLIADDAHKAGGGDILVEISHVSHSNNIYQQLKDVLEVNCLYGTDYQLFYGGGLPTLPDMTSDVLDALNSGVAWINYIGHGNETTLADELILDMERDISSISPPTGQLPVWVVGSCDLGHYDNTDCFMEALISKPDGAIAVISTTRLILSQQAGLYLDRMYAKIYDRSVGITDFRLGDLVRESKEGSADYVFQLFGDPAMPVILPRLNDVVSSYPDTLEVLAQNSISLLEDYQTELSHLTVRGTTRFIHQVYDGWVNLDYQLPGERIYSGDFTSTSLFYLPLDYPLCETCPAELKVFCDNETQPYQSRLESILDIPVIPPSGITDFSPPLIALTYEGVNVIDDQIVNIPYLFEASFHDTSGINLMNVPGHQIQYQIDNLLPENITDQFSYTPESSVEGAINILLSDELTGRHDVTIEAWDNANNRSLFHHSICFGTCEISDYDEPSVWTSITSLLTPLSITGYDNGDIYTATAGGLLRFSLSSGSFDKILPGEILRYPNLISVKKDINGNLWIGSQNPGTLQVYNNQEGLTDIIDNLNFDEISTVYFKDNSAFAIGKTENEPCVIEFRLDDNLLPYFQAVYQNFPEAPASISHISFSGDTIFAASPAGVFYGSLNDGLLTFSTGWNQMLEGWSPQFYFPGVNPVMVTSSAILQQTGASWATVYDGLDGEVLGSGWINDGDFYVLSSTRFYEFDSELNLLSGYPVTPPPGSTFTAYYSNTTHHFLGVDKRGFLVVDRENLSSSSFIPNTLFAGEIDAVTYASDGTMAGVNRKGMFHFRDGAIINFIASPFVSGYSMDQTEASDFSAISADYSPGSNLPWSILESVDAHFLFSNSGVTPNQPGFRGGVIDIDPATFEVVVYDTTDGILDGLNGIYNPNWTNRYLTINQIKKDHRGNLWVVNPYSEVFNHPAAIKLADGNGWAHISAPDSISYLPQEVAFDGYGRAWFAVQYDVPMNNDITQYSTGGLRVLDFGQSSNDESDDVWLPVINENILPSNSVWSIDIDFNNYVWVVTSGGIQGYEMVDTQDGIALSEILDSPAYAQIPFHIGDHIRVDADNNKWITTRHHGVFGILSDNSLLNNGTGLTTQNSGILSDVIYDVSFDNLHASAAFATLNGVSILDISELANQPFEPTGDVNGDNQTDVNDVVSVIFYILGISDPGAINQFSADINMDGQIDIIDVVAIVDMILEPSLLDIRNPKNIVVLYDKGITTIRPDGDIIVYHLLFDRDLSEKIEILSDRWIGFQNNSEFIAVNIHSCEKIPCENELQLSIGSDIVIKNGKGCTRDGYCIDIIAPKKFLLQTPYPNPFNSRVTISYVIPETEKVDIKIFDLLGRPVSVLVDKIQPQGSYTISWDATRYASGMYFVRMNYQEKIKTKKIMLVK